MQKLQEKTETVATMSDCKRCVARRYIYILTDGDEISKVKSMTHDEWCDERRVAANATVGNWNWECASTLPVVDGAKEDKARENLEQYFIADQYKDMEFIHVNEPDGMNYLNGARIRDGRCTRFHSAVL